MTIDESAFGPADHQLGMDHPHYKWSALPQREPLRWPGEAPLAFGAVVLLEHYEWEPPPDAYGLRQPSGGLIKLPAPDYTQLTHREYGHRVGVFRLLDLLDRHGVPATVAVDALTVEHYPWLVEHLAERGCELVGHGIAASRLITSKMSEEDEIEVIDRSLGAVEAAIGVRPRGWLSPEGVESFRTPQLLGEAGVDYLLDWPNDEQPYEMTVETGRLTSMPLFLEADDEHTLWRRRASLASWQRTLEHAATAMHADGATSGRLLLATLRPWLSGQPFRIPALDRALGTIVGLGQLHLGTAGELVDDYRAATAEPQL